MIASEKRINEIIAFCEEHGEEKTLKEFNINNETLHRYQREKRFNETRKAKILLLDIETARMIMGAWHLGKQRLGYDQVIKDWFMLGWSAKWLFEDKTYSAFVNGREAIERDDCRISKELWLLMNDADIIISHNGNQFDLKKITTRFIVNKIAPPTPFLSLDTFQIAKKQFGFSSNALNYLGKLLLSKEKLHTDYELWIKCENGDDEALSYMDSYCQQDVLLLEEVYLELRPYIKSHPNVGLLMDSTEPRCPNCGSTNIQYTDNYYTTPANQYRVVRCMDCGAPNRLPQGILSYNDRKNLIRPIAR